MFEALFDRVRIAKNGVVSVLQGLIDAGAKAVSSAVDTACEFATGAVGVVAGALSKVLGILSGLVDDGIDIAEAAVEAAAGVLTGNAPK